MSQAYLNRLKAELGAIKGHVSFGAYGHQFRTHVEKRG